MKLELIHPLLVHFPLALLIVGTVLRAASFWRVQPILPAAWIVLSTGVCFGWLAIIAGELAAGVVATNLCDEEVLHTHASLAYLALYLFTGALVLDWIKFLWGKEKAKKILSITCFIVYTVALIDLVLVGGFGGKLVYEQGAAVQKCCKKGNS